MHNEKPPITGSAPPRLEVGIAGPGGLLDHRDDMFFAAMQTTRMPMLVTDPAQPDNPIVFANRAFLSMTGYADDEVVGCNCRFLQGPGTDRASVAALRDAVAARQDITLELLNYRKDGTSFWNALYVSPVFNKLGELVYFFASQLDVSRRRDAEDALHQAQKMEALGQLTGGIAHDFNNLLQIMSGQLDLMTTRVRLGRSDEASVMLGAENLRSAVTKASALTSQLLAFSRKQRLEGRVINLNQVATGLVSLVESTLGDRVRMVQELEGELVNCRLDPTQLEVALLNVIVNARDAMPEGGTLAIRTATVDLREADLTSFKGLAPGRYASLAVTDTGVGIPAAILSRVMDPFFTTKEEGKGTGLGLSMVYGFARQSGGAVDIYSEVGVGTTVRLFFPAADGVPDVESERPSRDRGGSECVLVVDDRAEVAALSAEMLSSLGYRVLIAGDGRAAQRLVAGLPDADAPDLLFSDLIMPGGVNGYMLARALRERLPRLKVLLTTGYAGDLDGRTQSGATDEFEVIKKPFRMSELARRVRMVLDGPTGTGG